MFEHQSYPVQSQVKFMIDMFSHPGTASLLYVNDAKVLIDILIRNLTDLQPGDKVRLFPIGQSVGQDGTSSSQRKGTLFYTGWGLWYLRGLDGLDFSVTI